MAEIQIPTTFSISSYLALELCTRGEVNSIYMGGCSDDLVEWATLLGVYIAKGSGYKIPIYPLQWMNDEWFKNLDWFRQTMHRASALDCADIVIMPMGWQANPQGVIDYEMAIQRGKRILDVNENSELVPAVWGMRGYLRG